MKIIIPYLIIILSTLFQTLTYKEYYALGNGCYNKLSYEEGISNFKKSYKLKPHFKTAYRIAVGYSILKNRDSCMKYCGIVLREKEKSALPYVIESRKMYESCQKILTITTGGVFSGMW